MGSSFSFIKRPNFVSRKCDKISSMKKEIPKVPREKRKGTYLFTASRLGEQARKHAHKLKKKKAK